MHLIRLVSITPRDIPQHVREALHDLQFDAITRQFGMFFLHDLDLENRVLDGIPDKDDAQVDNAMCSAKHNQR
jgi:hypothetical protein